MAIHAYTLKKSSRSQISTGAIHHFPKMDVSPFVKSPSSCSFGETFLDDPNSVGHGLRRSRAPRFSSPSGMGRRRASLDNLHKILSSSDDLVSPIAIDA